MIRGLWNRKREMVDHIRSRMSVRVHRLEWKMMMRGMIVCSHCRFFVVHMKKLCPGHLCIALTMLHKMFHQFRHAQQLRKPCPGEEIERQQTDVEYTSHGANLFESHSCQCNISQQGPADYPQWHDVHQLSTRIIFFLTSEKKQLYICSR
jgi:hypothetical protein